MSKRAEEAARKAYPNDCFIGVEYADMCRSFYQDGYEQAEKDTIERAESHIESVLLNFLDVYTVKWIIKDFKKAMEDEK